MNLDELKGKTNVQNMKSATHKLIMKAAATFLTRGHLRSATIVSRFPRIPTTIIKTVMVAAKSSKGLENLSSLESSFPYSECSSKFSAKDRLSSYVTRVATAEFLTFPSIDIADAILSP